MNGSLNRARRVRVLLGVLTGGILATTPVEAADGLEAAFDPPRLVATNDSPMRVWLKLRNRGSAPADVRPDGATLRAETADGKALKTSGPLRPPLPDRLLPGKTSLLQLELASVIPDLARRGRYRVVWSHPSFPEVPPLEVSVVEKYATIKTNLGEIVLELHPEEAPKTVENFITLIKKGFYDGLAFHRIIPGFMMQGGDPKGDGTGGPGYTIKAEFNKRKHVAGTVSMARRADPDSAGCQFFICFAPAPHLDGQYTAFAQVVKGLDVVQKVEPLGSGSGAPKQKVVMEKVTVSETLPKEQE